MTDVASVFGALAPKSVTDPMPKPPKGEWTADFRKRLSDWCARNAHSFGEPQRYSCDRCRDSGFVVVDDSGPTTVQRCRHGQARFPERELSYSDALHSACRAVMPCGAAWVVEPNAKSAGDLAYRLCADCERSASEYRNARPSILCVDSSDAPEVGVWQAAEEAKRKNPALLVIVMSFGLSWDQAKLVAALIRGCKESTTFAIGQRWAQLGEKVGAIVWQAVEARGGREIGTHVAASFGARRGA